MKKTTQKTTQKTAPIVLARLAVHIANATSEEARLILYDLDRLLDNQGDAFGTEGQNDPRGDRRG